MSFLTAKVGTTKDKVTNYIAYATALLGVVEGVFASTGPDASWLTVGIYLAVALVSYFTGKDSDGQPKAE